MVPYNYFRLKKTIYWQLLLLLDEAKEAFWEHFILLNGFCTLYTMLFYCIKGQTDRKPVCVFSVALRCFNLVNCIYLHNR